MTLVLSFTAYRSPPLEGRWMFLSIAQGWLSRGVGGLWVHDGLIY
jgi:hypothetical protein